MNVKRKKLLKKYMLLYIMMIPGFLYLVIFHFLPMVGIVIAFQNYMPFEGISFHHIILEEFYLIHYLLMYLN